MKSCGHLLALVGVELLPAQQVDALVVEGGQDLLVEDAGVPLHQLARLAPDRLEQLAGVHAAGGLDGDAGLDPPLQAGDPHHEELVEVAGEDGEEPGPLEQRQVGVLGELEHPAVEPQPRELAVEEPVVGQVVVVRPVRRLDVEGVVRGGQPGYGVRALVERPGGGGGQVGRPGGYAAVGLGLR